MNHHENQETRNNHHVLAPGKLNAHVLLPVERLSGHNMVKLHGTILCICT